MTIVALSPEETAGYAPIWVRAAASIVRRLPAGRYRAAHWLGRRASEPFWMTLPAQFGSLQFRCDLRDALMREVCFTGRYEPQETALLAHLLRPGATLVDVGANWGYFTLLGAHLVGPAGRVISVEADPRAARTVRENVARNALSTVQVFGLAASDGPGRLSFAAYDPAAHDSGNFGVAQTNAGGGLEIETRALDDVLDDARVDSVRVLKIDIEGGEARAIAGLRRRLAARAIEYIAMELHPHYLQQLGSSPARVIADLRGFGYFPWRIDHSADAHRAAGAGRVDVASLLTPLRDNEPLGDWPHVLWTLEDRRP
jgi:FkbM family methyltransferase